MAKKKSSSAAAARQMESSVSPMLEVLYADPLFSVAAHPSQPILVLGLLTGHVICHRYDSELLEQKQHAQRQIYQAAQRKAFADGKISQVNRLVSRLPQKWWLAANHTDESDDFNIAWKTKRHKISCRQVIFDPLEKSLGENIYTVGADHIIKKALTETGRVLLKVDISHNWSAGLEKDAATRLCHSATHPFLLTGTENGHVLIYDSTNLGKESLKFTVHLAHDDAVNHILPMPAVLAYHYLTLGLTTLSHIDIRKGIVTQSDTQDDELLAMCYPSDLGDGLMANDTVLVAHGEGIATIWKNSKNRFGDQLSRIKINKLASIEAIISTMNSADAEMALLLWCGDSEGLLHRVNYKLGKVVETRVHSPNGMDEVGVLDIDYEYRLISAGMDKLKIWSSQDPKDDSDAEDNQDQSDDDSSSGSDDDSDDDGSDLNSLTSSSDLDNESETNEGSESETEARGVDNSDDEHSASDSDLKASSQDKAPRIIRRKRTDISKIISKPKRRAIDLNKVVKSGLDDAKTSVAQDEQPKPKMPTKQLSTKQLRNAQTHEHGIRRFEGL